MLVKCPICGRETEEPTSEACWCECGECCFARGQRVAEEHHQRHQAHDGGHWLAVPTPVVGIYAIARYSQQLAEHA